MPKSAVIRIRNPRGRHPCGTAARADMVLLAGRKGKGRELGRYTYWPWSATSIEEVYTWLEERAQRLGYEIVGGSDDLV